MFSLFDFTSIKFQPQKSDNDHWINQSSHMRVIKNISCHFKTISTLLCSESIIYLQIAVNLRFFIHGRGNIKQVSDDSAVSSTNNWLLAVCWGGACDSTGRFGRRSFYTQLENQWGNHPELPSTGRATLVHATAANTLENAQPYLQFCPVYTLVTVCSVRIVLFIAFYTYTHTRARAVAHTHTIHLRTLHVTIDTHLHWWPVVKVKSTS